MKRILFFIRSLDAGGAERQLVITAKGLSELGHDVTVLMFYSGGFYADELINTKVRLLSLDKKGRWDLVAFYFRLVSILRTEKPDVIYSFLGVPNIFSILARPFIPRMKFVWGVRASNMDLDRYDWAFLWSYKLECQLSQFADCIIANSHAGLEYAVANGFPRDKMTVIVNGVDTEKFQPDKLAGKRVRKLWNVSVDEQLIGLVGRIDPMKGHPIFLEAAAIIKRHQQNVRFVCVGVGNAGYEKSMHELATKLELDDVLIWAGRHSDMVAVYNAIDIVTSSSSYGEGFPNVIGEAMSCGVPCVVTDVGDSALIVGDVGHVVPPNNAVLLADAVLVELTLNNRGDMQRNKIIDQYSLVQLFKKTEEILCA